MTLITTIIDGIAPDPITGLGGANEGHINGLSSDILSGLTGGVVDLAGNHAKVTQAGTPNMTVLVSDGIVYVPNSLYSEFDATQTKFWRVVISGESAVAIAPNSSGSTRVDLICVKVDKSIVPDEYGSNVATVEVVTGTPGAGAPATPADHYSVGQVSVANGATSIVNANITDVRAQMEFNQDFTGNVVTTDEDQTITGTKTFDKEFIMKQIATPSNPSSGYNKLYFKSDGFIYKISSAGVEKRLEPLLDGWIDDTSRTWTYASASAFSMSGDQTSIFIPGTLIKLTQTTTRYFYVVSSVFSSGNTTVNVTGGTDYSVANAAITNNYYSYSSLAQGHPIEFNYTPTLTWTAGTAPSGTPGININKFFIRGSICYVRNFQDGFTPGSNVTRIQISMPVTPDSFAPNSGSITNSDTPNATTGYVASGGSASLFCTSVSASRFAHMATYNF